MSAGTIWEKGLCYAGLRMEGNQFVSCSTSTDSIGGGGETSFILKLVIGLVSSGILLTCCCYCCCRGRRGRGKEANCLCLLISLPFLPIIWLYYLYQRYKRTVTRNINLCCTVVRPEGNRLYPPVTHTKKKRGNEGFSWFAHSYMACLIQWGWCKLNFTKDIHRDDISVAVQRYGERKPNEWEEMVKQIQENVHLNFLIEYLNRKEPKFYFRILPSGSIREKFGFPVPSTSVLASDYDLMLVPDGIYVYDADTETVGDKLESFTTEDIKEKKNPEISEEKRETGFLWLKLSERAPNVWKKLCFERMTENGVVYYLSQLAVLDIIMQQIGKKEFLKQLKDRLHHLNKEDNEEIFEIDENLAGTQSCKYTVRSERTGPALNISITEKQKKKRIPFYSGSVVCNAILDVDFTIALACPNFPNAAQFFLKRWEDETKGKRWPEDEKAFENIKKLGCHVVPKPSKKYLATFQQEQSSENYLGASAVLEWRYSFSQAEMLLADHVPETARTSYMAFKAVIKTHINRSRKRFVKDDGKSYEKPRKPIPSYVLKTILLYELENNGRPTEGTEGKFFWALFNSLKDKVIKESCEHYWIEANLFVEMAEDDFTYFKERLEEIEKDPGKYIASNWLEWNRYVAGKCCSSCFEQDYEQQYVVNVDPIQTYEGFKVFEQRIDKIDDENQNYKDIAVEIY
ncbi:cyclic GMP-AMP synthase-like receptor 1 [Clytia hemisphaerica]|uniref:Uncharacterized protein n=1 Tax=Clytia hemisphaerica TaxID=252671 RepID=A0A7M5WQ54_9CNID